MSSLESESLAVKSNLSASEGDLSIEEQDLLQEILRAVRAIRYGSIVLTLHDGKIVEMLKTERIRKGAGKKP